MRKWLAIIIFVVAGLFLVLHKRFTHNDAQPCYKFGQFKLFSLLDGHFDFLLTNIVKDRVDFDHPFFHAQPGAVLQEPINLFLLDTGTMW